MKKSAAWPHVLSGVLQMLCSGVLFTWSYFRTPLQELFPDWTASMLSTVFTTHNLVVGVTMLLAGTVVKRLHPRIPLAFGGFMVGLGIFLMSLLPTDNSSKAHLMAIIFYGVISPIGVAFTGMTTLSTYNKWSPKNLGLINGLLLFAFGCASFGYGALASVLIPKVGILMTFRCFGILIWCLAAIAQPMTRAPREEDHIPPAPPRAENRSAREYTTPQALRQASFWGLFAFNVFMRGSGLMFADHAATIAAAFGGAALFGMLYSPANGSASVISGFFIDRIGFSKTMRLFTYIQLFGCACLFAGGLTATVALILIGLICGGFAYGGTTAVSASGTRILFGSKHFSSTYGIVGLAVFVAAILGNFGGIMVDKMNGSYYGIFALCSVYGLLSFSSAFFVMIQVRIQNKKFNTEATETKAE